jgi:Na+/H+-dicarboxylate symporter
MKRPGLGTQVLLGMIGGVLAGAVLGQRVSVVQPVGDLFIRLLVLAVVPLVFFNLLAGLTALTDFRTLGRLAGKIVSYYAAATLVAVVAGAGAMMLVRPGVGMTLTAAPPSDVGQPPSVMDFLIGLVPQNVVRAFADGNVAQIVMLAVLLGLATLFLPEPPRERLRRAFADLADLFRKVVTFILVTAPYGIGALIAVTVGLHGAELLGPLARFILGLTGVHVVLIGLYLLALRTLSAHRPFGFLKDTGTIWATTVATTSSLASLSVALDVAEKMRIPKTIYGFTLPLGIQVNKNGTASFLTAVVLFATQAAGVPVTPAYLVTVLVLGALLAAGSGGIPGGGFVVSLVMVEAFKLPLELAAVVGGIYRLVDMGITTVNVMGNMVGTVIVSDSEADRSV